MTLKFETLTFLFIVLAAMLSGCGKNAGVDADARSKDYYLSSKEFVPEVSAEIAPIVLGELSEIVSKESESYENLFLLKNDLLVVPVFEPDSLQAALKFASKNSEVEYGLILFESSEVIHNPETGRLQGNAIMPTMMLDFRGMSSSDESYENIKTSIFSFNDSYDLILRLERFAYKKEQSHPVPVIQQSEPNVLNSDEQIREWFDVFTASRKGTEFFGVLEGDKNATLKLTADESTVFFRSYGSVPEENQITIFIDGYLSVVFED